MSNASAASILVQEEVDLLQQGYTNSYCCLAAAALIFFEYIVTFPEEVHVIWGARLTTVTVIFALNRYLLMIQGVNFALNPVWWRTPPVSGDDRTICSAQLRGCRSCEAVLLLDDVTIIALEAVTASFSAFRTYAISGHQIVPALLVLLLALAPVGANVYQFTRISYEFVTYVGSYPVCGFNNRESIAVKKKREFEEDRWSVALTRTIPAVVIFARIFPAVSDLIVVLITWFKTSGLAIEVRKLRIRGSIATLLMRDGTLYFMALLLLNVLEIVTNIRYENPQNPATYITNFLPPISSILVSRFILNLRQASLGSMGLNTNSHSTLKKPDFTSRLVGNIGAEVQHTSLVFENVEDSTEDEQNISVDCETYELTQVQ